MKCCEGVRRGFWRASWKGSEVSEEVSAGVSEGVSEGVPWVSGGFRDKFNPEQLSEIVYFATS